VERVVGQEKEKSFWRLGEMEFEAVERVVFNSLLTKIGLNLWTVDKLKEFGDVKASKNGGFVVECGISKDKIAKMFFGRKWGKYVYRGVCFSAVKEKEM